jgi:hypothetical protein
VKFCQDRVDDRNVQFKIDLSRARCAPDCGTLHKFVCPCSTEVPSCPHALSGFQQTERSFALSKSGDERLQRRPLRQCLKERDGADRTGDIMR